jgi:vancomycin resistance protein YoaR
MGILGWKLNGNALYELLQASVEQEDYTTVTLDLDPVEPAEIDITEAYRELACDPTEPYYASGSIVEGTYGYTLDWEAAINQILEADYGDTLSIPMTPVAPKHTAEEFRAVLFRDRLSSYSSPHTANANRTNNLTLACNAINGTVINPGETFSFNGVVGERTAAKGYREATVYVGTESKDELGGGICQVASTVYDAALYAEMTITSRACHTFFVTYVPGGLDATVYWGSLDFAFRNDTEYPIRVNASVSGGYVNISIDGTKTNDHVVKLSSTKLSTTPYETVYEEDSSKPSSYREETTYPYTGYTYEAYQYIYDGNGNLLETNYLGKSTYQKRDQVITIGTG